MEPFHISIIADDGYAMGLAVTLKSLLSSTVKAATAFGGSSSSNSSNSSSTHIDTTRHFQQHSQQQLHVWLIDVGLSAETHNKLHDIVLKHNNQTLGRWLQAHAVCYSTRK
jgi:lipopolysaccharide biosynthesis glycosyltransferase